MAVVLEIKLALINVYVPPPFQSLVLYSIIDRLASFLPLKILIMGDFINLLDYSLDTSNPARVQNPDLAIWAEAAGLSELWRWKHLDVRQYSYLSHVFHSSSRLDMAFANSDLLAWISDGTYLAGGISDHTPLQATLNLPSTRGTRSWYLHPGWVVEPMVEQMVMAQFDTFWPANVDSSTPQMVWDLFKVVIRGEYILAIKTARVPQNSDTHRLQEAEIACTTEHVAALTPETL